MTSTPETQSERWLKYGGNVVLTSLVVILLAAGLVYISQMRPRRIDTTLSGINTLKPQTHAILKDLKQKVRIVSLYSNPETTGKSGDALRRAEEERRYADTVSDLLQEYTKASGNVSVDFIDPERESTKLDRLVEDVVAKYGKELEPYKGFFASFPAFVGKFKTFADAEAKTAGAMGDEKTADDELYLTIITLRATVEKIPRQLEEANDSIKEFTDRKIPDYKSAATTLRSQLEVLDSLLTAVSDGLGKLPAATPASVKGYAAAAKPRFEDARKLVKEQLDKVGALGELKLDSLRKSIGRSTVLVMGETDMKVLAFTDVWNPPDDLRSLVTSNEKPRLKFAGEQQISTALLALSRTTKPRVIFVRPGGPPLTQTIMRPAQFSGVARRLRDANFEVLEKDLSGQFAMQAQMQGFPIQEASDEQMRDRSAIWIAVSNMPAMSQQGPSPLPGKLKEHLDEGGSALVLIEPQRDPCDAALKEFGITARADALVVKEVDSSVASADSGDMIDQAQRVPYIFTTNRYGTHALTKPVGALQALLLPLIPVETRTTSGVTLSPLLPVTRVIKTWGETDVEPVFDQKPPTFESGKDIVNTEAAPMFAGVAAERGGASATTAATQASTQMAAPSSRVVVFGTATSFSNTILFLPDPELEKRGIAVPRFPGNSELFINAVFWLGHMDTMLEISPAAMEVSRIHEIPEFQLGLIRFGVLVGGLPLLVLVTGVAVWVRRQG